MDALHSVSVAKVAELLDLNNLTKEMNLKERAIECSDVNRPALQLSGYFEHFEERRIQIIGNVEYTYIEKMNLFKKKIQEKDMEGLKNLMDEANTIRKILN